MGGTLNYGQNVTDSESHFTGGYAGALWSTNQNNMLVDSLTIRTIATTTPFFSDNFNRANTGITTVGTTLGNANYVVTSINSHASTGVQILGNAMTATGSAGPSGTVLSYQGFTLQPEFTVSAVLRASDYAGRNFGVAFNCQDNNDFYYARVSGNSTLQVIRCVNGTETGIVPAITLPSTLLVNIPYTLTVSSSAAYNFTISLVGGGMHYTASVIDGGSHFTGGYAGALWSTNNNNMLVDSMAITTATASTATAYEIWANGYGIDPTPAGFLSDDDKDGMTALEEFAFNLNPTASDRKIYDPAVSPPAGLPRFTVSATPRLAITYLRRKNVPELAYQVEFGGTPGDFQNAAGVPLVAPIAGNADWETVTVADDAGAGQLKRFGRVKVLLTVP